MDHWGDRGGTADRHHLRMLLIAAALVWATALALALAFSTPAVLLALLAVLPTVCVPGSLVLDACRVQRELRLLTEDLVALTTFKDLDDDIDLEWSAAPGQRPARGGAPTPQGHEP